MGYQFTYWGIVVLALIYAMSGGEHFTPRERVIASAAPWAHDGTTGTLTVAERRAKGESAADLAAADRAPDPTVAGLGTETRNTVAPVAGARIEQIAARTEPVQPTARPAPQDVPQTRVAVSGSWVNLRAGPGTGNAVIDTLPAGSEAVVISTNENWSKIRLAGDERVGWMSSRYLEPTN